MHLFRGPHLTLQELHEVLQLEGPGRLLLAKQPQCKPHNWGGANILRAHAGFCLEDKRGAELTRQQGRQLHMSTALRLAHSSRGSVFVEWGHM
jgi:hypothetical protein